VQGRERFRISSLERADEFINSIEINYTAERFFVRDQTPKCELTYDLPPPTAQRLGVREEDAVNGGKVSHEVCPFLMVLLNMAGTAPVPVTPRLPLIVDPFMGPVPSIEETARLCIASIKQQDSVVQSDGTNDPAATSSLRSWSLGDYSLTDQGLLLRF
jgi:hypothetical protein